MVKIFKEKLPLVKYAIYYCVMFWAIASFVNVEAIALRYNINAFYEKGEFDFDSIYWLSADASSVVYEFYTGNCEDFSKDELENFEQYYRFRYYAGEIYTSREYQRSYHLNNWREYNIANKIQYNHGEIILAKYY